MTEYFHSVRLDFEKCKGCTNCIKRCPMEAIRVHEGKATIMQERCIDCGECIRACPNHAKISVTDSLEILNDYKYKIALPAPSFFAQFKEIDDVECVLHALLNIGFDDVFEVALAAEIVGFLIHQYIKDNRVKKPVFSSACPAVLRLMQIKFPDLLEQVAPVLTPMEVAARMAKEEAMKKTGLSYEDIGAFFISPCPAKVTEMKNPMSTKHSAVNGVIGVNLIYKDIIKQILSIKSKKIEDYERLHKATSAGMAWGYVTGESKNVEMGKALAVSGIHNVISLLEEIERGELRDVEFFEVQACTGGCVGGPLNIHNLFVGRVRLRELIKRCGIQAPYYSEKQLIDLYKRAHFEATEPIKPKTIMHLDEDMSQAILKLEQVDKIASELPGLDCGACGSPNCRALAEDIVRGVAFETDCVIKLREKVKTLAEEILDLARIVPPSMADSSKKNEEK